MKQQIIQRADKRCKYAAGPCGRLGSAGKGGGADRGDILGRLWLTRWQMPSSFRIWMTTLNTQNYSVGEWNQVHFMDRNPKATCFRWQSWSVVL